MRPSRERDGETLVLGVLALGGAASMRPSRERDGEREGRLADYRYRIASMRPSRERDGELERTFHLVDQQAALQ